jgi:hypothetical protein
MPDDPIGAVNGLSDLSRLRGSAGAYGSAASQQPVPSGLVQPGAEHGAPRSQDAAASLSQSADGVNLSDELAEEAHTQGTEPTSSCSPSDHLRALLGAGDASPTDASVDAEANRAPGLQRGGVLTSQGWTHGEAGIARGFVTTSGAANHPS